VPRLAMTLIIPNEQPLVVAVPTMIAIGLVPLLLLWIRKEKVASFLSNQISKWAFPFFDQYSLMGAGPYYDADMLPLETLESNWKTIRNEMDHKVLSEREHLFTLNGHVRIIGEDQQQQLLPKHDRKAFFFSLRVWSHI